MRDFIRETLVAEGTIDEADLALWRPATTVEEARSAWCARPGRHPVMGGPVIRRIAINTGGGGAPGLNAVFQAAVHAARDRGWQIFGIRDGYEGLLASECYPAGGLAELTRAAVAGIAHLGATILVSWPAKATKSGKKTKRAHEVILVDEAREIVQRAWNARRPDWEYLFHVNGKPLGPMLSELTQDSRGTTCQRQYAELRFLRTVAHLPTCERGDLNPEPDPENARKSEGSDRQEPPSTPTNCAPGAQFRKGG